MSEAWMIASGKGGVGKTMMTAALGMSLAKQGHQCCVMDLDIGLRDLDMALGLQDQVVYDVLDMANGDCRLKNAQLKHAEIEKLTLLPASQLGSVADLHAQELKRIVKKIKKRSAYVLMDAPAGIERGFQNIVPVMDQSILITTADDIAIRNAERVIEYLHQKKKPSPLLVVNRVVPALVSQGVMYTPQVVATVLDVPLLGYIPEDIAVTAALHGGHSFMETNGPAQQAILRIADRFLGKHVPMPNVGAKKSIFGFWKK